MQGTARRHKAFLLPLERDVHLRRVDDNASPIADRLVREVLDLRLDHDALRTELARHRQAELLRGGTGRIERDLVGADVGSS